MAVSVSPSVTWWGSPYLWAWGFGVHESSMPPSITVTDPSFTALHRSVGRSCRWLNGRIGSGIISYRITRHHAVSVAPSGMPEKSTVTSMLPVMKAPLKDSLRVSETIFPPAPVPRVRTVTAVAEASTPTLMPLDHHGGAGTVNPYKVGRSCSYFKSHGNGSIGADIQHHALDEQILACAATGINRDGPIAIVIFVLRHPRHTMQ